MSFDAIPVPQVLARPNLIMGGEREPIMLTALVSVGIAMASSNAPGVIFGVTLWAVAMPLWRWMGKVDPMLTRVYIRNLKYRAYYPARSRPFRRDRATFRLWSQNKLLSLADYIGGLRRGED